MDNTELHYVTYDPEAIWDEMNMAYIEAGGDILYPGDEKEMLLRSVLADIVQVFAGVDNALRMQTLRYAVGDYLDVIGDLRGCYRIQASAATVTIKIVTAATGVQSVLEAGTSMTADGEIFYELAEDVTLSGYEEAILTTAVASVEGSAGNGLHSGTELDLVTPNDAIRKIVAMADAAGGNEEEEDDVYRERIREYNLTAVTTGPQRQYEAAAKEVSSEIIDARALSSSAGRVDVYLILTEDAGSAAIIQSVTDALSAADTRPLTDLVTVYEATDVPYVLNVEFSSDGSSAVLSAISEAANEYQEWQDSSIGRAFNPDKLMAAIYQAGATRVIWGEDSSFDTTGPVEYTEIADTERCKGTITLSVIQPSQP